ncbi:hypothetical protein [Massilia glaciei]|uniref:Uncharacterized protein n=1 Tax=Massilia glaciei TaxID=1524097 RepID=A0A2U2HKG7_9BURK|nr:hypothetical protein [Massilia glaciei]PWF47955.1 hypothetical protein C7C56_013080 [Massilia glaciei]
MGRDIYPLGASEKSLAACSTTEPLLRATLCAPIEQETKKASEHCGTNILRILLLVLAAHFSTGVGAQPIPCVTCTGQHVAGSEVAYGKTLGQLQRESVILHKKEFLLADEDYTFMMTLYGHCLSLGDISPKQSSSNVEGVRKTIRLIWIKEMETAVENKNIDMIYVEAGCSPEHIGGLVDVPASSGAYAPISHIAMDKGSPAAILDEFRKYFIAKGREGLFVKMLNAKNTYGMTALDYSHHMKMHPMWRVFDQDEAIAYLCDYGGVYAYYKNIKRCK